MAHNTRDHPCNWSPKNCQYTWQGYVCHVYSEQVVPVYILQSVNSMNLFELPVEMQRNQVISFCNIRLPDHSSSGRSCWTMMSNQHLTHMCHVVHRTANDLIMINHAIQGKRSSTMVSNHVQIHGVRFWDGMQYIPGNRSGPKDTEKQSFNISTSCWAQIKSALLSSQGVGLAPS